MSDSPDNTSNVEAEAQAILIQNYAHVFAVAILFYDHILTLPPEMTYIWRSRRFGVKALFLLNRYYALLVNVIATVLEFKDFSLESCKAAMQFRQFSVLMTAVIVTVLLVLRIYALYGCSRQVLAGLVFVGAILASISAWQIAVEHSDIRNTPGCHIAYNGVSGTRTATGWESLLIMDTLVFALTVKKTLGDRPRNLRLTLTKTNDLVMLMLRDGTIYYVVMVLATVGNVLTFYFCAPLIKGILSTFVSNISVTMLSRLMLNIHQSGDLSTLQSTLEVLGAKFTTHIVIYNGRSNYTDREFRQMTPASACTSENIRTSREFEDTEEQLPLELEEMDREGRTVEPASTVASGDEFDGWTLHHRDMERRIASTSAAAGVFDGRTSRYRNRGLL
ncbi:hypothetical protein NEOLEDRAFT_1140137 [Neolentinus lepideus HHB14362 ss-1]|uniref:DUF6533 domain-containing protein n=1 Tax=Neolentinus lepideus HHB14362 ss-1 TaxID=1314782 RepID=A0A165PF73_9AGAM|nr:hypothetical protein NEOLEDRAFT_1140137 [Neolentinus lepideus HHB14362 ss-1]